MPGTSHDRRRGRHALAVLAALGLFAAPAAAGTAEGSLAVSVEVVASCRILSASGQATELVPCGEAGSRTAAGRRAPAPAAAPGDRHVARTVVERTAGGRAYLTTIY